MNIYCSIRGSNAIVSISEIITGSVMGQQGVFDATRMQG